jgi:hypothetical protein
MPTWETFKDIVLFAIAVYGAWLSTVNWLQARDKDKRRIDVSAGSVIPAFMDGRTGATYARITAVNTGHRPVTVTGLTFQLREGGRLAILSSSGIPGQPDTQLPATLADGESAYATIAYRDIAQALRQSGRSGTVKLTPICDDSAGTTHIGNAWDVDVDEFLGM